MLWRQVRLVFILQHNDNNFLFYNHGYFTYRTRGHRSAQP